MGRHTPEHASPKRARTRFQSVQLSNAAKQSTPHHLGNLVHHETCAGDVSNLRAQGRKAAPRQARDRDHWDRTMTALVVMLWLIIAGFDGQYQAVESAAISTLAESIRVCLSETQLLEQAESRSVVVT